jgi:hypothetical protein
MKQGCNDDMQQAICRLIHSIFCAPEMVLLDLFVHQKWSICKPEIVLAQTCHAL